MTSGAMQSDQIINNLMDQVKDLQERLGQLERHALTSQNILANKVQVGEAYNFENLADGGLVVPGGGGLPWTAADGTQFPVGAGDIAAADAISGVVFRGANNYAGANYLDASNLEARIEGSNHNAFMWHFDKDQLPPNMSWQTYSPFGTPSIQGLINNYSRGYLITQDIGAGGRQFLGQTISDITHIYMLNPFTRSSSGGGLNVGLRLDDASDNNYVTHEWHFDYDGSSRPYWILRRRSRIGGGAVGTNQLTGAYYRQGHIYIRVSVEGTKWSSWSTRPFLYETSGFPITWLSSTGAFSWTPARIGVEWYNETGSAVNWHYVGLDAIHWY